MSQQLYVMTPGNPQPQLLSIDELVSKIKSKELPNTVNCARLGESTWAPAKDVAEVALLLSTSITPPPLAATRMSGVPSPTPTPAPVTPFGAAPTGGSDVRATPIGLFGADAGTAGNPGTPAPGGVAIVAPTARGSAAANAVGAAKDLAAKVSGNQTAMIGGGAALGLLVVGIALFVWYRNSYSRGLVLEHVPEDCAMLSYVDIAGIVRSDPVKSNLDKLIKSANDMKDDSLDKGSKKDKERADAAADALKKQGINEFTVREFAMCVPTTEDDDGKTSMALPQEKALVLLGGTFRKGDVLIGIKEALEAATNKEDLCKIDDDDGLRMMKCSYDIPFIKKFTVYAALVDGRVLALSPDRKTLKSVKGAKDRAKDYSADKGEHIVFNMAQDGASSDGGYGTIKLKVGSTDTVLTIDTHYDKKKGETKLAKLKDSDAYEKRKREHFKDAAKQCFEKSPIDMLADAIEGATVDVGDDGVRYEIKVSNKDLAKAFKALAEADKDELRKIMEAPSCVTRIVEPYSE